ncbi:MAG TPA: D-aminoacyl-tRNA deacylase [Candidatus Kapabacteria bacterium]|nr:D-aminoacyl-tRNA deacylase [Candidatus Kapabacteria bacterium]
MKIIIQRVSSAHVEIEGKIKGKINNGFMILVGFKENDTNETIDWMCNKIVSLRIFSDLEDKMNLSLSDINGEILLISNFTLYGDAQKGNRPSFSNAAKPNIALPLYNYMIERLKSLGINTESGIFGASMKVSLINDGPVTITLER